MNCELCDKPAEIEFNCFLPSFGLMARGNVCLNCMSGAEHDLLIAVELIKRRAKKRGIELPVAEDVLAQLVEPDKVSP